MATRSNDEIKKAVREHYAGAITSGGSCCSPRIESLDPDAAERFVEMAGYTKDDLKGVPLGATSFGCGNPLAFSKITEGQTVLDLGSGAGLDLILAARKVGPEGRVIGLDMTPEMIRKCKDNLREAHITNADVRLGEMENMPVNNSAVDWIISNCVINLSPDKEKVFAESFRVLKPGGRLLVSDIVTIDLPAEYRDDMAAWVGCIAGAVEEDEYLRLVREAGFEDVEIVDKCVYNQQSVSGLANDACGCGGSEISDAALTKYGDRVASVRLSARKPG
jgi:SAM-dependent methyltransferase